jgi:hypothetical protein
VNQRLLTSALTKLKIQALSKSTEVERTQRRGRKINSAEDIRRKLAEEGQFVSLSTVYRSLKSRRNAARVARNVTARKRWREEALRGDRTYRAGLPRQYGGGGTYAVREKSSIDASNDEKGTRSLFGGSVIERPPPPAAKPMLRTPGA